jgi:sterol 3beta-glucosyltransferase
MRCSRAWSPGAGLSSGLWAARLAALGTGPRPIPYRRLSARALAAAIRDTITRPSYRVQAQAMARRLAGEDGAAPVVHMLARL